MKKRRSFFFALLLALLLAVFGTLSAFAAGGDRVYDAAGLFSAEEKARLETAAAEAASHTGMDMVVVTSLNKQGMSAQEYADALYETGDFGVGSGKSGLLYLIDMEGREIYISTAGGAIDLCSDSVIDGLLDDAYGCLQNGDYAGSAEAVLKGVEAKYDEAIGMNWTYDPEPGIWTAPVKKKGVNPLEFLVSLIASAAAGFGAVGNVKKKYAMKDVAAASAAGIAVAAVLAGTAFAFANRADDLLDKRTVRRAIPKPPPQQKRPGGSGGSGPFGHSTTHVSGGGMTHGGGGRKF